jgi:aromatic-L-amino-acid/L-tryptophan decarboxylase
MPEYLKTSADEQVNNYRDWGIQLGRRFRSLKLWFVIRHYGVEGIREMIREHVRLAGQFANWIRESGDFEIMAPVNLSLVCFRLKSPGLNREELNGLNRKLLERVNSTGEVYLTHTILNGNYCIRMSVGQCRTREKHVRLAWDLIRKASLEI